jgi:hypothetical protein
MPFKEQCAEESFLAGARLNGPLCSTTAPDIDAGTNALIRTPPPGPVCTTVSSAYRKSSGGKSSGSGGASRVHVVEKAIKSARELLSSRLSDLDAWEQEIARRGREPELLEPLSDRVEPIRRDFLGWFGKDDPSSRAKIRQRIGNELTKFNALHPVDFVTDPKSSDFAYVYPGIKERGKYERTVHLGSAFWNSTDDVERAGTLIHELSHFKTVGGTDDERIDFPGINPAKYGETYKYGGAYSAYGGSRSARLAISNPSLAIENADSFEFFIERRKPSPILNERGKMDTEGLGDFPSTSRNAG